MNKYNEFDTNKYNEFETNKYNEFETYSELEDEEKLNLFFFCS